jgi:hypothetical protein
MAFSLAPRALALAVALAACTEAATITWRGIEKNNQWGTANNWQPAQVPTAGDAVIINNFDGSGDAEVVLTAPATIATLVVGAATQKAKLRVLGALTVTQSVTISNQGNVEINSGEAALSAPSGEVSGELSFLSGLLQGEYSISRHANFGGPSARTFQFATITHTGSKNVDAGGFWVMKNESSISTIQGTDAAGNGFGLQVAPGDSGKGCSFTSPLFNWTAAA